jgi:hypothetical protein
MGDKREDEVEADEVEADEVEADEVEGDGDEGDGDDGDEGDGDEGDGDEGDGDEGDEGDEGDGDEGDGEGEGTPTGDDEDSPEVASLRAEITRQAALIETLRNQVAVLGGEVVEAVVDHEDETDVVEAFDTDYAVRQARVAELLKG